MKHERIVFPLLPLVALGAVLLAEGHFYGLFDVSFRGSAKAMASHRGPTSEP